MADEGQTVTQEAAQAASQGVVQGEGQSAGIASGASAGQAEQMLSIPVSQLPAELRHLANDPYNAVKYLKDGNQYDRSVWRAMEKKYPDLNPYQVATMVDDLMANEKVGEEEAPPATATRLQPTSGQDGGAEEQEWRPDPVAAKYLAKREQQLRVELAKERDEWASGRDTKAKQQAEWEQYVQEQRRKEDTAYERCLKEAGIVKTPKKFKFAGGEIEDDLAFTGHLRTLQDLALRIHRGKLNPRDPNYRQLYSNPAFIDERDVLEAWEYMKPHIQQNATAAGVAASDKSATIAPIGLADGPGGREQRKYTDLSPAEQKAVLVADFRAKHHRSPGQET